MTRRNFVKTSTSFALSATTAWAATRVVGANDRIRAGIIGCGKRNLLREVLEHGEETNSEVAAVCDIWRQQHEAAVEAVSEKGGKAPQVIHDYRDLLARGDIDAVVIGTPDHQHCTQLIEAMAAGKDAYVEKPLAMDMDELLRAVGSVQEAGRIVQMGTQVRSFDSSLAAREFLRAGKLGKIFKIEQSRNSYEPYWYRYAEREIDKGDTDWKAFLMHRKRRAWDPQQYTGWYGYRDFSHGPHTNLMVHFIDLVHYVTGAEAPARVTASGGIYRWNDRGFTVPDSVEVMLEYPEQGFLVRYCTAFGTNDNKFLKFFGARGVMDATRWRDPWVLDGSAVEDEDRIAGGETIPELESTPHMKNFLECVRSRKQPNAPIEAGYSHSIAVLMAEESLQRGRRMVYDPRERVIREG